MLDMWLKPIIVGWYVLIHNSHAKGLSYRVGPMGYLILIACDKNARFRQTINRWNLFVNKPITLLK